MTAPASRTSEPVEGNAYAMRDLRFISRLVLSCTLLARRRFQCDGGKAEVGQRVGLGFSTAVALGQCSAPTSSDVSSTVFPTRFFMSLRSDTKSTDRHLVD